MGAPSKNLVALLLLLSRPVAALDLLPAWEEQGLGAADAARAFATTALAGPTASPSTNPASLASNVRPQLRFDHAPLAAGFSADAVSYSQALGASFGVGLGQSFAHDSKGDFNETRLDAAYRLGGLGMGAGLRHANGSRPGLVGTCLWSADLGLLWQAGTWPLSLGAAMRRLPLGQAVAPSPQGASLAAAWGFPFVDLGLDLQRSGEAWDLKAGLEADLLGWVSLRLGLGRRAPGLSLPALSGGVGLRYGQDLRFDYGLLPTAGPEPLHLLSVAYAFGKGWAGFRNPAPRIEGEAPAHRQAASQAADNEEPDLGAFELDARVAGRKVDLSWSAPPGERDQALRYSVTMGLLPNASFKAVHPYTLSQAAWSGEMSLPGVTYYFRVESVLPDGSPGPVSKVRAVQIP